MRKHHAVNIGAARQLCPGNARGIRISGGCRPLDLAARYLSEETGAPLVTAAQLAEICGVQTRTVYQWVRRRRVEIVGLGEAGEQLFDSSAAAVLCPAA
jgi:hypothetical protein